MTLRLAIERGEISAEHPLPEGLCSDMLWERPAPSGISTIALSFYKSMIINILFSSSDVAWWKIQLMRKLTAKLSRYEVKDCERYVNHRSYEAGAGSLCRLASLVFWSSFQRLGNHADSSASGVTGRLTNNCVR